MKNVLCNQQTILHHLFNKEAVVNEFLLRCMATPSCYMYMHSMKNIILKKKFHALIFFKFNVEQTINQ